jgi:predicted membrane-bound dolichyl-phosphate-mannose-protein mannosyltransferase
MCTVALGMVELVSSWARARPWVPLALLGVVCLVSLGARSAWLGAPCRSPCQSAGDHLLIFDEAYYVNAARVIAGIHPPAGAPYEHSPPGDDPNGEHPQLAKLIIAGSIELFGDGPLAWRLGSLVLGTIAVLGMYALARAAGGSRWVGVGAAALMAADNLLIVHGRIGTLDIYALAAMVWGAALYLRGRPLVAGVIVGVGACAKEIAPYVLLVLLVLELLQWLTTREELRARLRRLGMCVVACGVTIIALLSLLQAIAPSYADASHQLITGGAFGEIAHIIDYASHQTSPHGPKGIASYPWWWLGDYKPITYLSIDPAHPAPGLIGFRPPVHFLGMISPPILLAGLLGLVVALVAAVRRSRSGLSSLGALALAWFLATFLPFELTSLLLQRTSYLYYMVVVMPGIYLAAVYLIARLKPPRPVIYAGWAAVLIAAILMYPVTPIFV